MPKLDNPARTAPRPPDPDPLPPPGRHDGDETKRTPRGSEAPRADNTPLTYSPDPTHLAAGAGTAAAQAAQPRMVADTVNGGWDPLATGATAGIPGAYTPAGARKPANRAGLTGIIASPQTTWTVGQYVTTADAAESHWSSVTHWTPGRAPV